MNKRNKDLNMTFTSTDEWSEVSLIFRRIVSNLPIVWVNATLCLHWGTFVRFVSIRIWNWHRRKRGDSWIQFFEVIVSTVRSVLMFDVRSWCFANFVMIHHQWLWDLIIRRPLVYRYRYPPVHQESVRVRAWDCTWESPPRLLRNHASLILQNGALGRVPVCSAR